MTQRTTALAAALLAAGASVSLASCRPTDKSADLTPNTTPAAAVIAEPEPDTNNGPDRWRVTPHGIGPVMIGAPLSEIATSIGASPDVSPEDRVCSYLRAPGAPAGVAFMIRDGVIARVDVNEPGVLSAEGAGIGSTDADVRRLYADQLTVRPHKYTDGTYLIVHPTGADSATHRMVFESDGRVVTRMRGGRLPEVEWVEGCS